MFTCVPMNLFQSTLYWLCYSGIRLLALLPVWLLYGLSDVLSYAVYHLFRYRRKVVEHNLALAFPEKTAEERQKIARKFYRNLCDQLVETIKMFGRSKRQMSRLLRVRNPEVLENLPEDVNGVCVATGHFGNWEYLASLEGHTSFHMVSLYHTLRNPIADRLMLTLRQRFGTELISMKNAMKPILRLHQSGRRFVVCFIIDQSPKATAIEYWTKFLGQDSAVFLGMEKFAVKLNMAAMYAAIHRVSRGHYEIVVTPICMRGAETSTNEITEAHVHLLEQDIRQSPESWLWSHKRWKHRKPDTA